MSERLTTNYTNLVSLYQQDVPDMVNGKSDAGRTIIPVIKSGDVWDKQIVVRDDGEDIYDLPKEVAEHYEELMSDYSDSTIYDNTNIRVTDWKIEDGRFVLQTGRTTYFSSLVTNRAMDKELSDGGSVREKVEGGPKLTPLSTSKLSNHLGFNGFLESADGKLCFVERNKDVSIGKGTYGTSVGAALKTKYALRGERLTAESLDWGIRQEFHDELKVGQSAERFGKKGLTKVTIIAAYRDLLEGGKPQLLVYAKSDLTAAELSEGFRLALEEKDAELPPKDLKSAKEFRMREDGTRLVWVDESDFENAKVEAGKVTIGKEEFVMLPSASASVQMTADFLKTQLQKEFGLERR